MHVFCISHNTVPVVFNVYNIVNLCNKCAPQLIVLCIEQARTTPNINFLVILLKMYKIINKTKVAY